MSAPKTARMSRAVLVALAVALIVVTGTVSATAQPATPPAPVPPTATTPAPTTPTPAPSSTVPPSRWVTPPSTTPPAPTPGGSGPGSTVPAPADSSGPGAPECGVSDISGCVAKAIDGFFQRLVETSLNPLLDLLGHTLLTTPEPGELPHVGALWSQSWQIVVALYGLLVMAAGVLLMVREALQTRWSLRELGPRLVVGFLAGAMSMVIATTAIGFANALARALAGEGVDAGTAAEALNALPGAGGQTGIFALLLMVALVVMLVVLLVSYVVRVAVTVILIVAAPLALMCHALPGLDGIARWWWRSFTACLAIQVAQSLILVTVLRVFLTPGGWEFFGPNAGGLVDLIVALALMGVLIKTPFWLLSVLRIGQGRSFVGSLARGYATYRIFGLLKGGNGGVAPAARRPRGPRAPTAASGSVDPYARVRATRDGQLMLPLQGVRRVRRTPNLTPPIQPGTRDGAPNRPRRAPRGRQLAFDFTPPDPYRGVRAGRDGQYPLPIPVRRVRPTPAPPPESPRPSTGTPPGSRRRRPEQLALDFTPPTPVDPYARVRQNRTGQYPLPFPVTRVTPTPPPPTPPQPPAPVRPTGRQLHLPLPDLPVRRRAPRKPRGGHLR
ncbi:hypothetical protein [Nocardia bovistercoris]|uniref:Type IV secretion system protein n=1 Tax=Nocardia bovistercoris TaxID=2785916 RepID=A0A931N3A7_9NOCA|nr:hypothetical protein [Nocardia bovistercoris]MBH0777679.1 hypothetical protein [Nocardia bovistercoris]